METFYTTGEQMVQRELETDDLMGVEHYVPGQHHAVIVGDDVGLFAALSYVTARGDAVLVLCRLGPAENDEWVPYDLARVAGVAIDKGPRRLPDDFELSETMLEVLDCAEERYEEAFDGL